MKLPLWCIIGQVFNFRQCMFCKIVLKSKIQDQECISRKLLWTPVSKWHGRSFCLKLNPLIQTTDETTTGLPFLIWGLQVCISARVLQQGGSHLLSSGVFVQLFPLLQALWVPRLHKSTLRSLLAVRLKWWGWWSSVLSESLQSSGHSSHPGQKIPDE